MEKRKRRRSTSESQSEEEETSKRKKKQKTRYVVMFETYCVNLFVQVMMLCRVHLKPVIVITQLCRPLSNELFTMSDYS